VQGATVVDFAYHVHTDVGNQMVGVKARPTACMRTALGVRALACGLPGSARGVSPVSMACIGWSTKSACGDQHTSRCAHPRSVTGRVRARQVNGKLVELSHALANAEVVEVLTYPGPPTALTVQRHQVRARACCLGLPRSRARACGRRRAAPALDVPGRMGLCTQQDTAGRGRLPDGQAALPCPQASLIAPAALRGAGPDEALWRADVGQVRADEDRAAQAGQVPARAHAPAAQAGAGARDGRAAAGRAGRARGGARRRGGRGARCGRADDLAGGAVQRPPGAAGRHRAGHRRARAQHHGALPHLDRLLAPVCGACMPERSASLSSWCRAWPPHVFQASAAACLAAPADVNA